MHIQPYRTLENIIEGAVITFTDITKIILIKKNLSDTNTKLERMATIIKDANDAITLQDLEGNILAWNPMAEKIYGWSEEEASKINIKERIPHSDVNGELKKMQKLANHEILKPYKTKRLAKDGSEVNILLTSTALLNEKGDVYAISTTERAF
jgi:two-component system CheB/CheR fusion protein